MNFLAAVIVSMSGNIDTGVMYGQHINSSELNNTHPYVRYEDGSFGTSLSLNSVENGSLSFYYKKEIKSGKLSAAIRAGVTTGYHPTMEYKGKRYKTSSFLFINDNIMMIAIPEFKYKLNNDVYINSMIVGNSVSIGMGYSF